MTEYSKAPTAAWWQVTLEVPSAIAEDASASLISAGALGVQVIDNAEPLPRFAKQAMTPVPMQHKVGHALLVASYADNADSATLSQDAVDALTELGLTVAVDSVQAVKREDRDWAERWKQYFKPLKIGRRLWIVPSWDKQFTPPTGSVSMILDPGMAFGTGQHATTALCLKAIELYADGMNPAQRQAASLVDVGCGTAVLAIGAAKLGIGSVLAIDNDPEAVEAAAENVRTNHVERVIKVTDQPLSSLGANEKFSFIVANILAHTLIEMRTELLSRLQPGATLVLSGILATQADEVIPAYVRMAHKLGLQGFEHVLRWTHGEWVALRFDYGAVQDPRLEAMPTT